MAFPVSLDDLDSTRGSAGQKLNNPNHVTHHTNEDTIIEALQAKVGIDSSAVTTSHDYLLRNIPTQESSFSMNGNTIFLDPSGDSGLESQGNDQIQIRLNGATDFSFFIDTFLVANGSTIDMDGNILILSANAKAKFTTIDNGIIDSQVTLATGGGTYTFDSAFFELSSGLTLRTNTIAETTATTGVTIDSLFIKDADLPNNPFSPFYQQSLINGSFDVWQRNTTFTTPNDDTYGPDRWNFLVEANGAWTFARDTDVPTASGLRYSLKATNVTLNNQCAIVQIIEAANTAKLIGQTVSLSFYAKTNSTEIANLRATVLAWDSTADTVTSDVIGTWASDGTDPTFATNWTKEIAGSNKALTSSWQRFTVENISLDTASTTNLAVVIWVDDGTIAANDDFYVTGIQLNKGATAVPLRPFSFEDELAKCQRYYEKTYQYGTTPNTNTAIGTLGVTAASTTNLPGLSFKVRKRIVPTTTLISQIGTNNKWTAVGGGDVGTSVTAGTGGENGWLNTADSGSGFTAGALYYGHFVADAEL